MAVNKFIKDAVDMAKSLQDFVDSINTYRFTMDDINDIAFFKPDIKDSIEKIGLWINNMTDNESDKIVFPELVNPDTITPPLLPNPSEDLIEDLESNPDNSSDKVSTSDEPVEKIRMTKEDYDNLGYFLATECDGDTLDDARRKAYEKFPMFAKLSIFRFASKKTYIKDSDIFFTINNGIVKAVEGHPIPETDFEFQKIMECMKNKDRFHGILGNMPEDVWKPILIDLAHACGDVGKIAYTNLELTGTDLVNIETVKRAAIYGGFLASDLSALDMCILISDAISKTGNKKKITRITNFVKKHWNVNNLRPEQVFAILNKKEYPEISDKFFK